MISEHNDDSFKVHEEGGKRRAQKRKGHESVKREEAMKDTAVRKNRRKETSKMKMKKTGNQVKVKIV